MGTKLQTLNQQQKLMLWSERVTASRSSGQTVSSWCRENNVSIASCYKWQNRIFQMAAENAPQFMELQGSAQPTAIAVLYMGGAKVEVSDGIEEKTLAMICRCLRSC